MKAETRKRKLAELLGIEIKKPPTKEEIEAAGTISREADAAILFALDPKKFVQRECENCGFVFAVNRSSIACCSDTCRVHYMWNKYKIIWDPTKDSLTERWSAQRAGAEPLIVPPQALELILPHLQTVESEPELPRLSLDALLDLSGIGEV